MNNSPHASDALLSLFRNLSVGKKLAFGFGAVLLTIFVLVAFIEVKLFDQDELEHKVFEVRLPTTLAGHDLINGINYSLAALRGYMILGNDKFKQQRQEAWEEIEHNLDVLRTMSESWTDEKNIETLRDLEIILADFKVAQTKVERISHTEDEQPAMKILLTEAAPRAGKVVGAITAMINDEKKLPATPERKALLAQFADSRGSFAMGLASIRGYLISGDMSWANDFKRRWKGNTVALDYIQKNSRLLTASQLESFKTYVDMRAEFAPFPDKMFEIRGSDEWNMANYLLGTEAAPAATKAMNLLQQMVDVQNELVDRDEQVLRESSSDLRTISALGALLALVVGGLIAWYITRIIVTSLSEAIAASNRISAGDLSGEIKVSSKDETGQLLLGMKQMQDQLTQVIEQDVQSIVDTAKEGDLAKRIDLSNKQGFYRTLSSSINELVEVNERVVNDTVRMFGAMSHGDLSQRIDSSYQGAFGQLKQDANQTMEQLTSVIEGDIQALVNSARAGDLSKRIPMAGKEGFFSTLSAGINELVNVNEQVVGDNVRMLSAMANGDLSQRIETPYQGAFDDLKQGANLTAEKLVDVIEGDIQSLVDAANKGDLTQRIDLEGKEGFFRSLSQGVNELIDVNERIINDTVRVISAMAEGDLTAKIDESYQGLFGQLKDDTNRTQEKLTSTIANIRETSGLVSTGSGEIAAGNLDLSRRTEAQAATLEETAASMEQMAASVKENAANASGSVDLAMNAKQVAENGGSVVSQAIAAMDTISQSSKEIGNIVGVVDEIAFQTNLLALNAAVEAARAGEQGRGFAVVASEVRTLAQRSSAAAKEIKQLIHDSERKIGEGAELVNNTGEFLSNIVQSVDGVVGSISGISNAAQEQNTGIQQVNLAVSQMDEMTQQNAALVEEATAASASMNEQSRKMIDLLSFFKVDRF